MFSSSFIEHCGLKSIVFHSWSFFIQLHRLFHLFFFFSHSNRFLVVELIVLYLFLELNTRLSIEPCLILESTQRALVKWEQLWCNLIQYWISGLVNFLCDFLVFSGQFMIQVFKFVFHVSNKLLLHCIICLKCFFSNLIEISQLWCYNSVLSTCLG